MAVFATVFVFMAMAFPSFYVSSHVLVFPLEKGSTFTNSQNIDLITNLPKTENHPLAVGGFNLKTDDDGLAVRYDSFSNGAPDSIFKNEKQEEIYIVRQGDTVSEIAEMFGVSANTIVWANDLGRHIFEGQHLVVLPFTGVRHQVKSGDTVSSIASNYSASAEEIMEFNNISADGRLSTGHFIDVPGGVKKTAPPRPVVSSSPTYAYQTNQGVSAASSYFIRPVRGGIRTQGLHGRNAVDIAAPIGTPIYAAASGRVVVSGWHSSAGYGYYIVIEHPNGTKTLYAHNSRNLVGVGEWVGQGEIIAEMGSTGFSTGPHIHFEVHGAANPF